MSEVAGTVYLVLGPSGKGYVGQTWRSLRRRWWAERKALWA